MIYTVSTIDLILRIFEPILLALASILGTWLTVRLSAKYSAEEAVYVKANEIQVRDGLHQAAENGLKAALAESKGSVSSAVIDKAVAYVEDKNPAGVEQFDLSSDAVADIVRSKVADIVGKGKSK